MLALTGASGLLALGCRGDDPPSGADTEAGASSSGGEQGTSGTAAEPMPGACTPGETRACYEGPPGTESLGACTPGQQACAADGSGWSECTGQVWPEPAERCDTPEDDDCDGSSVCEPVFEWSQSLTGLVTHVAGIDGDGAAVVGSGAFDDFQGDTLEGTFVVVLDADGELVWSRSSGVRSFTWPSGLAVEPSSAIVVVGSYDGAPDLGGGPLSPSVGYGGFAVRYGLGGAHEWSFGFPCDGYQAAALGPDGTTYLVGGYVYGELQPELGTAEIHLVAVEPDGDVAWRLPGRGAWTSSPISLVYLDHADGGELVLVAMGGGADLTLGDLSTPAADYEALAVRIGLDGTPLGYQRLLDPLSPTYDVRAIARPGGLLAAAAVTLEEYQAQGAGVLLMGRDEALAPLSQSFLGPSTWLRSLTPYPDGTALVAVEFSGLLELGPIGVGLDGPAVAVVDDEGRGRWAEMLHAEYGSFITWAAATPEGSVMVTGSVSEGDGLLAGGAVHGTFVAKLRP